MCLYLHFAVILVVFFLIFFFCKCHLQRKVYLFDKRETNRSVSPASRSFKFKYRDVIKILQNVWNDFSIRKQYSVFHCVVMKMVEFSFIGIWNEMQADKFRMIFSSQLFILKLHLSYEITADVFQWHENFQQFHLIWIIYGYIMMKAARYLEFNFQP